MGVFTSRVKVFLGYTNDYLTSALLKMFMRKLSISWEVLIVKKSFQKYLSM